MKYASFRSLALVLVFASTMSFAVRATASAAGVVDLRVDNLSAPLGIDDPTPRFSWQLADPASGAAQSAYRILVASSAERLAAGKADVWDSHRIASAQSAGIAYAGPALKPSTRYYWRVELWNAAGKPYAASKPAWWETGLLAQSAWKAPWVGYETPEEAAIRHASSIWIASPDVKALAAEKSHEQRFDYRTTITLAKPVKFAALYATARDTVSAWVGGTQVLTEAALPPWQQFPWEKYVRAEVTKQLADGDNIIAIEALHYVANPNGMASGDAPPMIATLVVQYDDGSWATFGTGTDWMTATHPDAGWQWPGYNDSAWKPAVAFVETSKSDPLGHPWIPDSIKSLRHAFTVGSPVRSARIYATALGAYELFLNGHRIDDQVLAPGWTDYRERVIYQTYDVTSLVSQGNNDLSALLAPGWYSTALEWFQQPNNYGLTPPALRAQLRIEHANGSVDWINTGSDWQAQPSPIVSSEIYDGETQDARLIGGNAWQPAIVISPAPLQIEAQDFQPIRVERTLQAKSLTQPKPGVWVYDFGQNFSGVEKVRVSGPAGTVIQLRFAEVLNPDGTIYTDNLRTAKATDHFILSGNGVEEFTPQFTFHGFRYAELTGLSTEPAKDAVEGLVFHTDAPFTVKLATGSPMIDQLWSNILWGQRSNFVGLPTDCPQRDERLGWMADAQVFWRAAVYNMDLAAFSRKYSADMRGTQIDTPYYGIFAPGTVTPNAGWGAAWSDAGVIIPYTSWLQTGDTTIIDQNWSAMTRYLAAIESKNPNGLWKIEAGTPFGDWLSPEGKTDFDLVATAYWAYDVDLMRRMAHATYRIADEQKYAALFGKIRAAFEKRFVRSDGFVAGGDNTASPFGVINNPNAKSSGGDTQTGYVLALHMNLLPENLRAAAAKRLAEKIHANHDLLGTGFLGTPYLLEELAKAGYSQLAYTLLLNTAYPSWGYMVEHGATTMWERWNGDQMMKDPSMNSFNHYAYGAVADWIYRYAAGIDTAPAGAGFHTIALHPYFDARLGHLSLDYDSPRGPIHSDWTVSGSTAEWHVTLPANTEGWLPLTAAQAAQYKLDGAPLAGSPHAKAATRDGKAGFALQPGTYSFQVALKPSL